MGWIIKQKLEEKIISINIYYLLFFKQAKFVVKRSWWRAKKVRNGLKGINTGRNSVEKSPF